MMRVPTPRIAPVFKLPDTNSTITTAEPIKVSLNQKEHKMISATIPPEKTFDLPEGTYSAGISSVRQFIKQAGSGPQDWVRFLFEVKAPGLSDRFNAMAGRSFKLDLNPGSELRNWLTGLLGRAFFKDRSGQEISLDSLVGVECQIELVHVHDPRYEKPLVVVANLWPERPIVTSTKEVQTDKS